MGESGGLDWVLARANLAGPFWRAEVGLFWRAARPPPSLASDDHAAQDAAEPANARTQDVMLAAGELLKVDVSSQEPVELVVLSQQSGVISRGTAVSRQITYQAPVNEPVRI
jgi:hypothetical protein